MENVGMLNMKNKENDSGATNLRWRSRNAPAGSAMRATVSSKVAHNKGQESAGLYKALLGIQAAFPTIIPTLQRLTNGSYGDVGTCCELILALKSVNHEQ
ncbi:hypothetical protein SESBI_49059 [Sesbania bispinosa]|nr:hypothetical protein SESBI_49059 [Sesbania bispinosa]